MRENQNQGLGSAVGRLVVVDWWTAGETGSVQ